MAVLEHCVFLIKLDRIVFGKLPLHETTKGLVRKLLMDLPLTNSEINSFGVYSGKHYRVLQSALIDNYEYFIEVEVPEDCESPDKDPFVQELRKRLLELDAAIGDTTKLRAFVEKYAL